MPYLKMTTNLPLDAAQKANLASELSALIAQEIDKPAHYVMIELVGAQALYFAGNDQPAAYLECKSIGLTDLHATTLAASLCRHLTVLLPLTADRIYIEFSNSSAQRWGWNRTTFG
jgi:phenylpyruvate tautomerase PptA (4-oxalocrotonate tautomerase family)